MIKTLITALLLGAAGPVMAASLVLDSGWNDDEVASAGAPSSNSPWTFTLTSSAFFRVTDLFVTGDVYTITDASNGILASTTFSTDGAAVEDYAGTSWADTSYSRLSLLLSAGTYAISIAGDCAAVARPASPSASIPPPFRSPRPGA